MIARERFTEHIDRICRCLRAPETTREDVLAHLCALARDIDLPEEDIAPREDEYVARPLYSDPNGWSLTAVVLKPGQQTPPHDHSSWGCAATVRGTERNRWLTGHCPDDLRMAGEFDLPPGEGYIFSERQIHQAVGADPRQVTVSLHFLVQGKHPERQRCHEEDSAPDSA